MAQQQDALDFAERSNDFLAGSLYLVGFGEGSILWRGSDNPLVGF